MKKIVFAFLCALMPFAAQAAELSARADNPRVAYGETVVLRVTYDGSDNVQPDFSALQKDFTVYSTSSSVSSSMINGVSSQKKEWALTLLPEHEGKQTVPSVKAGKYATKPVEIEVVSAGEAAKAGENGSRKGEAQMPVFEAELTTDNSSPYIGQEVAAVLTLRDNRDVRFTSDPYFENADDWDIKSVGQPEISSSDGLNTIKIHYALTPRKSGKITLPRAVAEGYYITYESSPQPAFGSGLMQLFDVDMTALTGRRNPVLFKSKAAEVEVKSVPADYEGGNWVPASALAATAEWENKNRQFKAGETAVRKITVTAQGVAEDSLPEIEFVSGGDWKQYPDKPQYTSAVYENGLISQESIRVVYIPQKSGKLTLPAIEIPWFNVKTGKTEKAVIPAEEIEVSPNAAYETVAAEQRNSDKAAARTQQTVAPAPAAKKTKVLIAGHSGKMPLAAVAAVAFLCGLAAGYLLRGKNKKVPEKNVPQTDASDSYRELKKALSKGDCRATRDSLLKYGQSLFPETKINNLQDLADMLGDEDFSCECQKLNAVLYGESAEKPDAKVIIAALKKNKKNGAETAKTPLPPLYKK